MGKGAFAPWKCCKVLFVLQVLSKVPADKVFMHYFEKMSSAAPDPGGGLLSFRPLIAHPWKNSWGCPWLSAVIVQLCRHCNSLVNAVGAIVIRTLRHGTALVSVRLTRPVSEPGLQGGQASKHNYSGTCLHLVNRHSLPSSRQHLSYNVCLEVRGKIIRTFLCCIVYWSCAQS